MNADYVAGLVAAQQIADRVAGNAKDFDRRTRQGAGIISAELRTKINEERAKYEPANTTTL